MWLAHAVVNIITYSPMVYMDTFIEVYDSIKLEVAAYATWTLQASPNSLTIVLPNVVKNFQMPLL